MPIVFLFARTTGGHYLLSDGDTGWHVRTGEWILQNGGVPVKLGNDGFAEKLNRLARIYQDLQPQMANLVYIDLDYNDKIIVKKV